VVLSGSAEDLAARAEGLEQAYLGGEPDGSPTPVSANGSQPPSV
jgi:hypothetical protein